MVDYRRCAPSRSGARKQGRYLGIGLSTYIEACGLAPSKVVGALGAQAGLWESAVVRVHPTGKVTVLHRLAQPRPGTRDRRSRRSSPTSCRCRCEDVEIVHGDTGRGAVRHGAPTAAAAPPSAARRSTCAVEKIHDKGKRIAAHLLEAAPGDIEFEDGKFHVRGVARSHQDVRRRGAAGVPRAQLPADSSRGSRRRRFYDPSNFVFPFGTHIAVVEVDRRDGRGASSVRYVAVDDVGNVINPMIVDGQLHGGIAQGVGQALFEDAIYDESGQLDERHRSWTTRCRGPTSCRSFELDRTVTPSPHNPLGVKGVGEAGTIASTAAVANAVIDALAPFGITHLDMPLTPARIWPAIQAKKH